MNSPSSTFCVEHPAHGARRLSGAEAIVIIVVVGVSAVLATVAALPVLMVLQLLVGAGLVAAMTIAVSTRSSLKSVRTMLGAALTAG